MTSSFMVVTSDKDGATEGVIQGDVDAALVSQDMAVVFPVREMGLECSRNIFQG